MKQTSVLVLAIASLLIVTTDAIKYLANANSDARTGDGKTGSSNSLYTVHRSHPDCDCKGNLFPHPCYHRYTAKQGLRQWHSIFNISALANKSQYWKAGVPWQLSFEVTSDEDIDREFSFGGGTHGFFMIRVPGRADEKQMTIQDRVRAGPRTALFSYRGLPEDSPEAFMASEPELMQRIWFTQICLKPVTCAEYSCPDPYTLKKDPDKVVGDSDMECCEKVKCSAFKCEPTTMWSEPADKNTSFGNSVDACCKPKLCPTDICKDTGMKPKVAGTAGSTKEECCHLTLCSEYVCSNEEKWILKENKDLTLKGDTDKECCEPRLCSAYSCSDNSLWKRRDDAEDLVGSTDQACCDAVFCSEHTCSDTTKMKLRESSTQGSTDAQCCMPKLCSDHSCPAGFKVIKDATRISGSTDAQCCLKKSSLKCKDYTCSDSSKFKLKHPLPEHGDSDDECCDELNCKDWTCSPDTQWLGRPDTQEEGFLGYSNEECCAPRLCQHYSCSSSTKWMKKIDSPTHRNQGSTDKECCEPRYCDTFSPVDPTKWKPKPESASGIKLQGSTPHECLDAAYCSTYECQDGEDSKKKGAEKIRGSTEMECCMAPEEM
eukprot:TRINITY_DN1449_c0_g1_i6.p1 TRINITY_DN1449_c0_g1~~TRINITY_DN1449_c0_g1_i6.p1  ORF type:complete len:601 (-),score=110.07 TRINITY_DN1449_c0_g1_i6:319-2121(-)